VPVLSEPEPFLVYQLATQLAFKKALGTAIMLRLAWGDTIEAYAFV
jgi:hypothetical protein